MDAEVWDMEVREIGKEQLDEALGLVWEVFLQFVAPAPPMPCPSTVNWALWKRVGSRSPMA